MLHAPVQLGKPIQLESSSGMRGDEGDLEVGEAAKLCEAAEGEALHHQDVHRHAHLRRPELTEYA